MLTIDKKIICNIDSVELSDRRGEVFLSSGKSNDSDNDDIEEINVAFPPYYKQNRWIDRYFI